MPERAKAMHQGCQVAVIWIDWYAYHVARFRGLQEVFGCNGEVCGIEIVGGVGVHSGYNFRSSRSEDLPVRTLEPDRSWAEVKPIRLAWKLWRTLSEIDPAIVLVPGYYNIVGWVAAVWARVHARHSILMTESSEADHARTFWKEGIKRVALGALFDAAICGGAAHSRYLEILGFSEKPIAGFYDVVGNAELARDAEALRSAHQAADFHLPEKYFLFVGRLAEEKNVLGLLHAWVAYRRGRGELDLVIAGDGPERAALQTYVHSSGLAQHVHFLGHRPHGDLAACFAFATAFVLPSKREPWGLVVNEAMACSLPVIVSERCGCAEDLVTPGMNGFLFNPDDPQVLRRCLQAIDVLMVAKSIKRLGVASRKAIEPYTPEAFGRSVQSLAKRLNRRIKSKRHAPTAVVD